MIFNPRRLLISSVFALILYQPATQGFSLFSKYLKKLNDSTVTCTFQNGTTTRMVEQEFNEAIDVCSRRFGPIKQGEQRTVSGLTGERFHWRITGGSGVQPIPISSPLF
jgi:hypothetical protein